MSPALFIVCYRRKLLSVRLVTSRFVTSTTATPSDRDRWTRARDLDPRAAESRSVGRSLLFPAHDKTRYRRSVFGERGKRARVVRVIPSGIDGKKRRRLSW